MDSFISFIRKPSFARDAVDPADPINRNRLITITNSPSAAARCRNPKSDELPLRLLVIPEDVVDGALPTKASEVLAAAAAKLFAQLLVEQHLLDAARDVEDVLGVHHQRGVSDHL